MGGEKAVSINSRPEANQRARQGEGRMRVRRSFCFAYVCVRILVCVGTCAHERERGGQRDQCWALLSHFETMYLMILEFTNWARLASQ